MDIIVGKTAGFCYGVKRAVEGSIEEINNKEGKIYCLGELVHNKQVIEDLEIKGITFIEDIEEVTEKNAKVIIRAHGVDKRIYDKARKLNLNVVDYTCPNVARIHKIAKEYQNKGYYIFLTGTGNHPEVIGIISHCGEKYSLIENEEDVIKALEKFKSSNMKKVLLISQTTYSMARFENVVQRVKESITEEVELVIKNTICLATEQRQKETKELSKKVDMMIIIGGKNSSNTKKLYEIAHENCKNTICIETVKEIEERPKDGIIGIMAGASTPQKSIDEVVELYNN